MASVRCFVAVRLPETVHSALGGLVEELCEGMDGVRWVRSEGIHLTLKFLGEIDRDRLVGIGDALARAVDEEPISLRLTSLGGFPRADRARVVWVGLDGDLEALGRLQSAIESELETVGFEREQRVFRPHLTVGRARRPVRVSERAVPAVSFESRTVSLMESLLRSGDAVYRPIQEFPLRA